MPASTATIHMIDEYVLTQTYRVTDDPFIYKSVAEKQALHEAQEAQVRQAIKQRVAQKTLNYPYVEVKSQKKKSFSQSS